MLRIYISIIGLFLIDNIKQEKNLFQIWSTLFWYFLSLFIIGALIQINIFR